MRIRSLWILLVSGMLVCSMAGCGKGKTEETQGMVGTVVFDDPVQDVSDNLSPSVKTLNAVEVLVSSKNYALLRGEDKEIYLVNRDGDTFGRFEIPDEWDQMSYYLNDDAFVTVIDRGSSEHNLRIYDLNGNLLLEGNMKNSSIGITGDGWVIREKTEKSFEDGTTQIMQAENLFTGETKEIPELPVNDVISYWGNGWFVIRGNEPYAYNVYSDYFFNGYEKFPVAVARDGSLLMGEGEDFINRKYYTLSLDGVFSEEVDSDLALQGYKLENEGTLLYDDEGRVFDVSAGNGAYTAKAVDGIAYVISNSGYFYEMDENGRLFEPIELEKPEYNMVSEFGSLLQKQYNGESYIALYTPDGQEADNLGNCDEIYVNDPDNFVTTLYYSETKKRSVYNLYKMEQVTIEVGGDTWGTAQRADYKYLSGGDGSAYTNIGGVAVKNMSDEDGDRDVNEDIDAVDRDVNESIDAVDRDVNEDIDAVDRDVNEDVDAVDRASSGFRYGKYSYYESREDYANVGYHWNLYLAQDGQMAEEDEYQGYEKYGTWSVSGDTLTTTLTSDSNGNTFEVPEVCSYKISGDQVESTSSGFVYTFVE